METETLFGGLCDGLLVQKTDNRIMYSGKMGDGWINVYVRQEDGCLHFSHRVKACELPKMISTSAAHTVELRMDSNGK